MEIEHLPNIMLVVSKADRNSDNFLSSSQQLHCFAQAYKPTQLALS